MVSSSTRGLLSRNSFLAATSSGDSSLSVSVDMIARNYQALVIDDDKMN